VDVVRHDDELVEEHVGAHLGGPLPLVANDAAGGREADVVRNDLAEQRGSVVRADGEEIRARTAIVVAGQPGRTSVVAGRVVWHGQQL
jgi:hypothetical protein